MIAAGNYTSARFRELIGSRANVIVECGCADGGDTLALMDAFTPMEIYAFEADPEAFAVAAGQLQAAALNYPNTRIVVEFSALGGGDGKAQFWLRPQGGTGGQSSLYPWIRDTEHALHEITVRQRRLDTYMAERDIHKIDLLCLDAQGGEEAILRGLGRRISDVHWIVVEVLLSSGYYSCGRTAESVLGYLARHGFEPAAEDNFADFANVLCRNARWPAAELSVDNQPLNMEPTPVGTSV